MSKYKKTIKNIIKTINNNPKLKIIFYFKTKNRKYTVKQLLNAVLLILKSGVSSQKTKFFVTLYCFL